MTIKQVQNIIKHPVYVAGLQNCLLDVADILAEQGKKEYADALTIAAVVCVLYADKLKEKPFKCN